MKIHLNDLTPELFLEKYWQKQPLIIKAAFADFVDPIEADELAGLAMEDFIESRIVSNNNSQWDVKHGPFTDYSEFGENNWTLLVQAVNNWFEGVDALITPFQFIPNWRIDDVMVSFSTPGGGVGPHLDQYDVFIIQGQGKRHWRVGKPDQALEQLLPHEDLKQVSDFQAIIDVITEPGDLLYIPPNHPHDGIAIDNSLNYSIGFQAPNPQELISGFADYLLDNQLFEQRFNDSARRVTKKPHTLESHDIALLTEVMNSCFNQPELLVDFLGKQLTQVHHTLNLLIPTQELDFQTIEQILAEGEVLSPVLGLKCLVVTDLSHPTLYANGESFEISQHCLELANTLAQKVPIDYAIIESYRQCLKCQQLLAKVINKGLWTFE
ncbi:cupin domain-containing protein [Thalassotalea ponticola]|uniref:cupin domain-containing protein n=1 Tax=Thalassotalea ponticola TaxID=1523392 RepID=UPI0025B6229C|nr:cupin domain-containing protein [Thalassotalea ponticola]MDN3651433.1 cupin domain-containing protein [Thalassotalea ponticola]